MGLKAEVRVHRRIAEIGRDAWDRCALAPERPVNPFIAFDFLDILEESGCAVEQAGWAPHHLAIEDQSGAVGAVMPLYLKSHSQGEYVFDHAWADAYERAGGRYYPKLVAASPFSPVTGPRLLIRAGLDRQAGQAALLDGALTLCGRFGASTLGVNFPTGEEWRFMGQRGLLLRQNQQYHWFNAGYGTFDDFLAALSSSRRKTIRRERREAAADLDIVRLTGADLRDEHWDAFFGFYMDTGSRKWGRPYLTRAFFSMLNERMADKVLLIMARRGGRWIAGAINFLGSDAVYGRNWGALEHHPFLHFELCYYQAVEYAIQNRLARVEAGAQGEHKLMRGYMPVTTYSAHFIANPALRRAVAEYLARERAYVRAASEELAAAAPFRKDLVDQE